MYVVQNAECMFFSNKLTPAISRTYAGHRQELVPLPFSLLTQSTEFFISFPIADIKRTLDAMSWVKVLSFFIAILQFSADSLLDGHPPLARR